MGEPIYFGNLILAIQKSAMSRNCRDALGAICGLVDFTTWTKQFPTRYIAVRSGMSHDTVTRTLPELRTMGLISWVTIDGSAPDWSVNVEAIMALEGVSLKKPIADRTQQASNPTHGAVGVGESNQTQDALDPTHRAYTHTHGAVGPTQPAVASPILVPDPLLQATRSNPLQEQPPTPSRGSEKESRLATIDAINQDADRKARAKRDAPPRQPLMLVPDSEASPNRQPDRPEAWQQLWDELKPGERDCFADVEAIWAAYVTANPTTIARGPTTKRYRDLRSRLKTYPADALCMVPAGAQLDTFSRDTHQTGRFEWIFQERNVERFAEYGRNGLPSREVERSTVDHLGRQQWGDTGEEIWAGGNRHAND